MAPASSRSRGVLSGLGVAGGLLLLGELGTDVAGAGLGGWSLVVDLAVGAVAAAGVWLGARDVTVPVVAGAVLLWPALAGLIGVLPGPPGWVPLLGTPAVPPALLAGVLLGGAALSRKAG